MQQLTQLTHTFKIIANNLPLILTWCSATCSSIRRRRLGHQLTMLLRFAELRALRCWDAGAAAAAPHSAPPVGDERHHLAAHRTQLHPPDDTRPQAHKRLLLLAPHARGAQTPLLRRHTPVGAQTPLLHDPGDTRPAAHKRLRRHTPFFSNPGDTRRLLLLRRHTPLHPGHDAPPHQDKTDTRSTIWPQHLASPRAPSRGPTHGPAIFSTTVSTPGLASPPSARSLPLPRATAATPAPSVRHAAALSEATSRRRSCCAPH